MRLDWGQKNFTTQNKDIKLTLPTSTLIQGSFIYNGGKIFNNLSVEIRNISALNKFKRAIKNKVIDRACYSLEE